LWIAKLNFPAVGVDAQRLLDIAKTAMAIVLDKQSSQPWKAMRLGDEQAMEGQSLRP
jgi:hypothetical protein